MPIEGRPIALRQNEPPRLFAYRPAGIPEVTPLDALLILPGGAYGGHADHENYPVAQWAIENGLAAFVLLYRVHPVATHPNPLTDTLDAMRLLRVGKAQFGLTGKIAVLGFSAGGHAAAALSVHGASDPQTRPDATLLLYPVITMHDPYTHPGSREHLLGPAPSAALIDLASPDLHVTPQTPPAFIAHGFNDQPVPMENALIYAQALRAQGVPFELHIFPDAPHGFVLGVPGTLPAAWPPMALAWLRPIFASAAN